MTDVIKIIFLMDTKVRTLQIQVIYYLKCSFYHFYFIPLKILLLKKFISCYISNNKYSDSFLI